MANIWELYQTQPSFVLGFHGTEKALVDRCMADGTKHLASSEGRYEWLGHGIYFWENDPQRGLEWATDGNAKKKIQEPDIVGAVLDLGYCLDLTTRIGLDEVNAAYMLLKESYGS